MNIFQELIVVAVFVLCQGDTKYFLMLMLQREVNQFSYFIPCPSSGFSANAISPVIISPKSLQSLKGHTTLNQIPSKQQLNWIITLKDYSISMLVQFLKSKYFPHANFLQTKGLNLFLQIHHSRQKSFFFFFLIVVRSQPYSNQNYYLFSLLFPSPQLSQMSSRKPLFIS